MAKRPSAAEIAAFPTFEELLESNPTLASATDYEADLGIIFKLDAPVEVEFNLAPNYKGASPFLAGQVVVGKRYIGLTDKIGQPTNIKGVIDYCRVKTRLDKGALKRSYFVLVDDIKV